MGYLLHLCHTPATAWENTEQNPEKKRIQKKIQPGVRVVAKVMPTKKQNSTMCA